MDEGLRENKSKTVKGLVWGGVFSALSQLIGLVFGIILARLLTPSDYGLVGLLAIFTAVATLLQESGFVFVTRSYGILVDEKHLMVEPNKQQL